MIDLAPSAKGYTVCFAASSNTKGPSATGYVPRCYKSSPWRYNTPHPTVVRVAAGHTRGGIDIALPRGGAITGRITAATNGAPLPQTPITVFEGMAKPIPS